MLKTPIRIRSRASASARDDAVSGIGLFLFALVAFALRRNRRYVVSDEPAAFLRELRQFLDVDILQAERQAAGQFLRADAEPLHVENGRDRMKAVVDQFALLTVAVAQQD